MYYNVCLTATHCFLNYLFIPYVADFVTVRRGGGKRIRRRIVVGEGGQVIVDVRKAARHGRETPQTGVGAGETGIGGRPRRWPTTKSRGEWRVRQTVRR